MLFHIRHGLTALTLLLAVATPVFGHPHPVCDHDHEHHQDLIQRDTHPHGPAKGVEPITLNEYGVRSRIRDLLESTKDLSSREILKRDFTVSSPIPRLHSLLGMHLIPALERYAKVQKN